MQIQPIRPSDVPVLSQLAAQTFTETFGHLYPPEDLGAFITQSYDLDRLIAQVTDKAQFWRMIWRDDDAIAYVQCRPMALPHADARPEHEGEIHRLYIHSAHQGKGLGKRLMNEALNWLEGTYGPAPQWLGVWSGNMKAQTLYAAYGFVRVGAYKFPVGRTLDEEFILRRQP